MPRLRKEEKGKKGGPEQLNKRKGKKIRLKIVQVMGPVVDVVFEDGDLPDIKDALEVENNGKKCVMEVSQHLGK